MFSCSRSTWTVEKICRGGWSSIDCSLAHTMDAAATYSTIRLSWTMPIRLRMSMLTFASTGYPMAPTPIFTSTPRSWTCLRISMLKDWKRYKSLSTPGVWQWPYSFIPGALDEFGRSFYGLGLFLLDPLLGFETKHHIDSLAWNKA